MEQKELINQIIEAIEPCCTLVAETSNFKNSHWTEIIKKQLGSLGKRLGYKISATTQQREYNSEWLYDLVWYSETEDRKLMDVPLVIECEWIMTANEIKADFEKFLLSKSTLKLMICEAREDQKIGYLTYFESALKVCPLVRQDELFLVAILNRVGIDATHFEFYSLAKNEHAVQIGN